MYVALTFGFNPDEYEFAEDSGANAVSVALLSGNIGDIFVTLVAVTNDISAAGRAEGEFQTIVENLSHVVFLAGSDYQVIPGVNVVFSGSSGASQSFQLTILSDDVTEIREYLEIVILHFSLSLSAGGPQLVLSNQEQSRVIILQAMVFITDADSKKCHIFALATQIFTILLCLPICSGCDWIHWLTLSSERNRWIC